MDRMHPFYLVVRTYLWLLVVAGISHFGAKGQCGTRPYCPPYIWGLLEFKYVRRMIRTKSANDKIAKRTSEMRTPRRHIICMAHMRTRFSSYTMISLPSILRRCRF
jgi:hypothetical protein